MAAEVGGSIALFAHDIAAHPALAALAVFGDHAVVADEGEGLRDDLPEIARVGERLDIPRHARREDELAHDFAFGAEGIPFEHLSVFQRYIYFLIHAYLPLISSVCT